MSRGAAIVALLMLATCGKPARREPVLTPGTPVRGAVAAGEKLHWRVAAPAG